MNQTNKYQNHLESLLKTLPDKPGIYQFYDNNNRLIYVGKAKSLKKRVVSYFNKNTSVSGKVLTLVRKIADIKCIVVGTEQDALLLENNLIKKYQPPYNIQLRDDKTYPWICIKNEPFPRIFSTRHIVKDGSQYFGPYASVRIMNTLLDLLRELYPLRNCKHELTAKNIKIRRFKKCLEYHIDKCKAPCEGLQTEEDYNHIIAEIRQIIKGNISTVISQLKQAMNGYAETYEFEKAQEVKEKIEQLQQYQSKSTIVNPAIGEADVFSIDVEDNYAYVNFLKVVNGAIIQSQTIEIRKKLDESAEEILTIAIVDFRQKFSSSAKEIIVPFEIDISLPEIVFTVPQRGDKKSLLELSQKNVKYYKLDIQKQKSLVDPHWRTDRILNQMKNDLRLKELPVHIECFDNSNIQGTTPVAAMVVFKNARPSKKEYKHYSIKTVEGADDYASMGEIIYRRYKRLTEEGKPLPQLIVIDGGKGQLSAALKSLETLNLRGKISIIGIAKRLEEIYYPGDSLPLYLDKKSETLKVIQRIRNEAHRFGITHHRSKKNKETIRTELTDIAGIGSVIADVLLKKFKSVKNIKAAKLEELEQVIGKAKAKAVFGHFN